MAAPSVPVPQTSAAAANAAPPSMTWCSLQKLDPVSKHVIRPAQTPTDAKQRIIDRYLRFIASIKNANYRPTMPDVLHYRSSESSSAGVYECGHGLYSAFERAWATHGSVLLSPDDVWLAVQLQFCRYMDANAEQLRDLFVEHAGTVELNVLMEVPGQWDTFMQRTMSAIQEQCKASVQADFLPHFSSSTPLSSALQRLAVMNCMQHYFTYRTTTRCGIERVGFLGTLDDWQLLRTYVAGLARFHLSSSKYFDSLQQWVDAVLQIVDHFIVAYKSADKPTSSSLAFWRHSDDQPSLAFWNNVINERREVRSGGSTYIKGWITTFLTGGRDWTRELDVNDIPAHRFNVPVTVDDYGYVYRVRLLGGFTGVEVTDGNVYRPQTSLVVVKVGEGEEAGGRVNPSEAEQYAAM